MKMANGEREIRDLLKIFHEQNVKYLQKLELLIEKQENSMQQISNSMIVINHNSTAVFETVRDFKNTAEKQKQDFIEAIDRMTEKQNADEKWYKDVIKYGFYVLGAIAMGALGYKIATG